MYAGLFKILGEKFYITIQPEILQKKIAGYLVNSVPDATLTTYLWTIVVMFSA